MRARATRREFLKATGAAAAAFSAASTTSAQSNGGTSASTGGAPWASRKTRSVVLSEPHIVTDESPYLNSSREIAGYNFVMTAATKTYPTGNIPRPPNPNSLSAFGMLTFPPGSRNIRIVDCTFETPWRRQDEIPHFPPGHPDALCGIQMFDSHSIRIENCQFDWIPVDAIQFFGCSGIEIRDIWSRNCCTTVHGRWEGKTPNRWVSIKRVTHGDGWGGADASRDPKFRSMYEPNRTIGSSAVVGWFTDSEIIDLRGAGEWKTFKLVTPIRCKIERVYCGTFMIQGSMYWDEDHGGSWHHPSYNAIHGANAREVEVRESHFRAEANSWWAVRTFPFSETVQLSYPMNDIRFQNCVFYRSDSQDLRSRNQHHAIQAWEGVQVEVRDCLFAGWAKPDQPLKNWGDPKGQSALHWGDYGTSVSKASRFNTDVVAANTWRTDPPAPE